MNGHFERISPEQKVASKPPLGSSTSFSGKRHSIHAVEPVRKLDKLFRHDSQHELQRREESSSWGNLTLIDSKKRSSSLAQLKRSGRTLSASNLAALSDTNLSLQVALPLRCYEDPGSQSNLVKKSFEVSVKRYFDQLTVGCGNKKCWNKFCASCPSSRKLNVQIASIVSIELATLNKEYFCKESNAKNLSALPLTSFSDTGGTFEHFLHKFFSCSPFKFLFSNNAMQSSTTYVKRESLGDLASGVHGSGGGKKVSSCSSNICDNTKAEITQTWNPKSIDTHVSKALLKDGNDNLELMEKDIILDEVVGGTEVPELVVDVESLGIGSSSLEEFEGECALEMSSSNYKELSLTHLTLPMLESSIENYKKYQDPSFLVNTIRTVFTSPEALNASFQYDSSSEHDPCGMQLNVIAVRKAYQLLLNLEPKSVFTQPLQNSTEIHLKTLQSCDVKPCQVFQLVILLENPLLLNNYDLLQTFCSIMAQLAPKARQALLGILVKYDSLYFQRIVKVCCCNLICFVCYHTGYLCKVLQICNVISHYNCSTIFNNYSPNA